MGLRDGDGDGSVSENHWYTSSGDENYNPHMDFDHNGRIDGWEAWMELYNRCSVTRERTICRNDPAGFVLHEIDAGAYDEVKKKLTALVRVNDNFSDSARVALTESSITAGFRMRDTRMFELALVPARAQAGGLPTKETYSTQRRIFAAEKERNADLSEDNKAAINKFIRDDLVPLLCKSFKEGEDRELMYVWLYLTGTINPDAGFQDEVAAKIAEMLSENKAAVDELIDKIALKEEHILNARIFAAKIIGGLGREAVMKLIGGLDEGGLIDNDLRIMAALPGNFSARELEKRLKPYFIRIREGNAEYRDYKRYGLLCEGQSEDEAKNILLTIGLTLDEANDVISFNSNDEKYFYGVMKCRNIAARLEREHGLTDVKVVSVRDSLHASSKDYGGDGPAYHDVGNTSLDAQAGEGRLVGVYIEYECRYSADTNYASAALRFTFGNRSSSVHFRKDSWGSVFVPGNGNYLKMEVWQGDHFASAKTEGIYLVYQGNE